MDSDKTLLEENKDILVYPLKIFHGLNELDDTIKPENRVRCKWIVINDNKIDNNWTILDILDKMPPLNWIDFFESIRDTELNDKDETIDSCICFPLKKNIFRSFNYMPPEYIKLIVIGMDPYPNYTSYGEPRATGLCFSVSRKDIIPRSLLNIYKELENTFKNFKTPSHGDLTYWALQGTLLLNSSLTVEYNKPGSHARMWEGFIIELIRYMDTINDKGIVYVLFGADAKRLKHNISDKNKVIESAHPVARDPKLFFGQNTFFKINDALYNLGYKPLDWNVY